jgi:upstream activation factor subunit UAF30
VKRILLRRRGTAKPIAPACGECPKRTGNQPELFADVKSADVCTDPVCFKAKRAPERDKEEIYRQRLFMAVCAKIPATLGKPELRLAAMEIVCAGSEDVVLGAIFPAKDGKKPDYAAARRHLRAAIAKADASALQRIILVAILAQSFENCFGSQKPEVLLEAAKLWKVDPAKVRKAITDEEKAAAAAKAKPKAPPAKTTAAKPTKPGKKGRAPHLDFMKPMQPSALLAAITGDKPMPRTEVTSKLWGYIKKNNLQDKTNRRMINCDAKLSPIMGNKKQISMFEMVKFTAKQLS